MYSVQCIKAVRWGFGHEIQDLKVGQVYGDISIKDYNELIKNGFAKAIGPKPKKLEDIVCFNPYVQDRGKAERKKIAEKEEENQRKKIKRSFEGEESFYHAQQPERIVEEEVEEFESEEDALFHEMELKAAQKKTVINRKELSAKRAPIIKEGFQDNDDEIYGEDLDIDAEDEDLVEEKMLSKHVENKMLHASATSKAKSKSVKIAM